MATTIEVKVPDIGNYQNIPVIELLVKPGDVVKKDQGLVSLESDKATMEVPAPVAGVVKSLLVKLGDTLSEGGLVALLETESAAAPVAAATSVPVAAPAPVPTASVATKASAPAPQAQTQMPVAAPQVPPTQTAGAVVPHASPAVRLFARELGVDLTRIAQGSGRKNRLTKEDVQNFVKRALSAAGGSAGPGVTAGGLQ